MVTNHETAPRNDDINTSAESAKRIFNLGSKRAKFGAAAAGLLAMGGLTACGPDGEPLPPPVTTEVPTEAPVITPKPIESPEPSPTPTETEVVITPEMQEKLAAFDAMESSEFKALPLEDRLLWQSWVMSTVDKEWFMNKWADWNKSPNEVYPGEPSEDNTVEEAIALSNVPYYAAFLKDSGAWEGYTSWDRNRAEKIYSTRLVQGDYSGFDGAFDYFESKGVFYQMGQIGGNGTFIPLEVSGAREYVDDAGRACRSARLSTGTDVDVCLYDFVDYSGSMSRAWVSLAGD